MPQIQRLLIHRLGIPELPTKIEPIVPLTIRGHDARREGAAAKTRDEADVLAEVVVPGQAEGGGGFGVVDVAVTADPVVEMPGGVVGRMLVLDQMRAEQ